MKIGVIRFLLMLSLISLLLVGSHPSTIGKGSSQDQLVPEPQTQGSAPANLSPVRLVSQNNDEIILELETRDYSLEEKPLEEKHSSGARQCQELSVPGYAATDQPGAPQLPIAGTMVGIPSTAQVELVILESSIQPVPGHFNLCPVAQAEIDDLRLQQSDDKAQGLPGMIAYHRSRDPQAYSIDIFEPQQAVELVMTGFMRSQRVAQLRFQPFQYNPVTGELRQFTRIRAALRFHGEQPRSAFNGKAASQDEGAFESLLQGSLLNYDQARAWRLSSSAPANLHSLVTTGNTQFKIEVAQDGIYKITYADLAALGVEPDSFVPQSFRLFNQGVEVAMLVVGEEDSVFDPEDYLLFYGEGLDTKYTATNVYYLHASDQLISPPGKRMEQLSAPANQAASPSYFIHQQHDEINSLYFTNYPSGAEKDVWYWGYVYAVGAPAFSTFPVTLSNIDVNAPVSATLSGLFRSYTASPQHHTRIFVNGHLVADAFWPANSVYTFQVTFPMSYLLEGANEIKVECPLDNGITSDVPLINYFKLQYADRFVAESDRLVFEGQVAGTVEFQVANFSNPDLELYDITSPQQVIRLSGFQVLPGSLVQNAEQEIYTLVFGQDTLQPVRRYLAQSLTQRLNPQKISLENPTDLKSPTNGADYIIITHPDFIASLQPLAAYRAGQGMRVKIVDIYDVYDEFNHGILHPEAIHEFLAYAYKYWVSPAPQYGLLVGDGTFDPRNYMSLGDITYIPPYLLPEVDPYMGETVADSRLAMVFGNDLLPDIALGRIPARTPAEVALVVNKILSYEAATPAPEWTQDVLFVADNADYGGTFNLLSDKVVALLPSGYTSHKVYYGINYTTVYSARTAIRDQINAGVLLVNYVGHAGVTTWASEAFLNSTWISYQTNANMLAFFVPMTCLEGSYQHPTYASGESKSLAENYLFRSGGGAVGSWSPTGLGIATGHDLLNRGLYTAFFHKGIREVGLAALQGDLFLLSNSGGSYLDLLSTYIIFGDPALRLHVPVKLSVDDITVVEGSGAGTPAQAIFTVKLSSFQTDPVTVDYTTMDGTATQGQDYEARSGILTFEPGETQKTVTVPVIPDYEDEDDETFTLALSNPVNAGLVNSVATATILDDDPMLLFEDVTLLEGDTGVTNFVLTLTLSAPSLHTITVDFTTLDGTALAGSDYTAASESVTFDPGDIQETITIEVFGDTAPEQDESFLMQFSNAVHVFLLRQQAIFTILNDDEYYKVFLPVILFP